MSRPRTVVGLLACRIAISVSTKRRHEGVEAGTRTSAWFAASRSIPHAFVELIISKQSAGCNVMTRTGAAKERAKTKGKQARKYSMRGNCGSNTASGEDGVRAAI